METSTVPDDIPSPAKVSSELERVSKPGVVVEEEDTSLERDSIDTAPNVAEVSWEGENVFQDKLIGKDKVVNAEAVERDLVDRITDPTEAEVSSDQVKSPATTEIVNEALEVTSKELNNAPEASEVFFEGDKIPAVDEKSESLEGEAATSVQAPADATAAEEPLDQVVEEKNEKSESLKGEAATSVEAPTDVTAAEEPLDQVIEEKNEKSESLEGKAATSVEAPTDATAAEEPLDPVIEEKNEKSEGLKGEDATSVEAPTDATAAEEPLEEKDEKSESLYGEPETLAEASTDTAAAEEQLDEVVDEKDERRKSLNGEAATSAEAPTDTTAAEEPLDQVVEEKNEKSESLKGEAATSAEVPRDTTTAEEPLDQVVEEKKEKSESLKGEAATSAEAPIDTTAEKEPLDQVVEEKKEKSESLEVEAATSAETPIDTTAAEEPLDQVVEEKNEKSESLKTSLEEPTDITTAEEPLDQLIEEKNDKSESLKGEAATSVVAPRDTTAADEPLEQVFEENNEKSESLKGEAATSAEAPIDPTAAEEPLDQVVEEKNEKSESLEGEAATSVETPTDTSAAEEPLDQVVEEKNEKSESLKTSSEEPTGITTAEEPLDQLIEEKDDKSESLKGEAATSAEALTDTTAAEELLDQVFKEKNEKSESLKGEAATSAEIPRDTAAAEEPLDQVVEEKKEKSESLKGIGATSVEAPIDTTVADEPLDQVVEEKKEKTESLEGEAATSAETPTDTTAAEEPLDQVVEEKNEKSESLKTSLEAPTDTTTAEEPLDQLIEEKNDKNESLKGEAATSVVAPRDTTAAEEPLEQVFEEKNEKCESLKGEAATSVEASTDTTAAPLDQVVEEENENSVSDTQVSSEDRLVVKEKYLNDETKEINLESQADGARESPSVVQSDFTEKSASQEPAFSESKTEDLKDVETKLASENDSNPVEPPLVSTDLSSIKVPVKDLEVESGFPEEHKSSGSAETKEPSSNVSGTNAGGEVVGPSSDDVKPSGVAEVETMQTPVEIHEGLEVNPDFAQTRSDEIFSEGVNVKKDDKIVEGGIDISAVPDDISPLAKVSYEEENTSEPGGDNFDTVLRVADVAFKEGNILEGDELVDKEKANAEAVERDLVETITDPAEAEVSSVQVKAPETIEIANDAHEVSSKEFNITSEASEVPYDSDKISAGDEKSESLEGEVATSVEAPKDITTAEEPLDQVVQEKKRESSINETQVPSEDKLVDRENDVKEEAKEINLQSQADGADKTPSVVQSDSSETFTSQEPVFSEYKKEDLKDTKVKPTSDDEGKQDVALLASTGVDISEDGDIVAETQEVDNPDSSKDKVNIKLNKSEDSKDEIQVLVPDESHAVVLPDASETIQQNVDPSTLTSEEALVEDPEVEFGSLEEQKSKESTETEEPISDASTIDAGGEVVGFSSYEIRPSGVAEVVEKKDDGSEVETIQTSARIYEDLEAKPDLAQLQSDENVSQLVEVKKDDEIVEGSIETSTVPDDVPLFANVSSEEVKASEPGAVVEEEEKTSLKGDNIDIVPKVAEVSLEGGNFCEGDKLVDQDKVVNAKAVEERDLINNFTDPTKAEVSSEQVIAPTTTEIVNEALEVTSQELNIVPEASEVSTEVGKVSVGDEEKSENLILGESTSAEAPKDITAVKELLDPMFEEKIEIPVSDLAASTEVKLVDQEKNVIVKDDEGDFINTSTDAIAAEASSEQIKSPEIVEEESDKQALEETSKELSIAPDASEVPSEDDKISSGEEKSESMTVDATTSVEAPKDITSVEESLDQVIDKKNEISITEKKALPEDMLVEKKRNLNEEAVEKDLVDTSADTTAADVYSDQVKASETAEIIKEDSNTQASEVTSKELNIASEASDVHSDGDEVFASDEEKRESLKGEDSTLVEAPEDIKIVEESPDQVIKQKSESSKSEMEAPDKDKLVDREKDVNSEAEIANLMDTSTDEVVAPTEDKFVDREKNLYVEDEQRDLIDTSSDAIAAEVSSEQVKAPEIAEEKTNKQALEETSKELNIAPEDSKVPAEDDKLSAGEEKSEILRVETETSVETPKDITTVKELLGQVIEKKKSESSASENKAPPEDKLVDKEKDVNAEAEERELVDTSTDPSAAEVASDQLNASETAENIKEDSNKQAFEVASKELDITSEAIDIPSKCDEVFAGDEEKSKSLKGENAIVEASKDITIAEELPNQVIKQTSESSKSVLVGKEKDVNADAEKTNLHDTSTDPTAAETAEITKEQSNKQSSEVTSIPEACEVSSEGDKVSSGEEEKIERFKGEDAASLKVPEDNITLEKSINQVIEENNSESSKNESEAPIETTRDLDTSMLFPEAAKDIIASEEVKEKQDEASNDLDVVGNKASDSENRKEEVLQNTTDKPEEEKLGAEKAEIEKSKDQGSIVSSDSADAKPTKEVSKRESNIFSKVKRSIVKAKKAILGKPSIPKSSSEAKN
ncbi:uncharacterized protein LOC110031587 [Phalaenopsis equestris]|uniref:uncharacterized protein LOC110031587 n=1 Tax=Phalaenopsis equestris TaxID=78828 RepID=UPI0009E520E9|nr:uncharacterized protein LOC110031587 [Phalaenopsis equestris]